MKMDFATIMTLLVLVSGGIWAWDAWVLAPRRRAAAGDGAEPAPPSKLVEHAKSFFPIFLVVLLLRSFLVEPFRIPSGSMMPTLEIGDFILVNKYRYGIRLPVVDAKVIEIDSPERGDIVVFRYPEEPSVPFIKRVVGLPGDHVAYYDKVLYINNGPVELEHLGVYTSTGAGRDMTGAEMYLEHLDGSEHRILIHDGSPSIPGQMVVPAGEYFVMGDNRDNSRDSRYWGTVPDENLIGKAFFIWMSWDWSRGGVVWSRLGNTIN
jgi:signal peptidase I